MANRQEHNVSIMASGMIIGSTGSGKSIYDANYKVKKQIKQILQEKVENSCQTDR